MPCPTAKTAPNVPAKPPTAAEQAEQLMRQRLAENPAPVDYKTGRLKSGAKVPRLWLRPCQGDCCLGRVVSTDPSTNPRATLQKHYTHGQEFAVFNPCVSHEVARAGSRGKVAAEHQQSLPVTARLFHDQDVQAKQQHQRPFTI
jgi:hypothetical protein